jgi:hypothetical protein
MDRAKLNCTIHAHRPVPCQGFGCRKNKRIWADFEEKVASQELPKLLQRPDEVAVEDSHEVEEVRYFLLNLSGFEDGVDSDCDEPSHKESLCQVQQPVA